jgi:hypothetical protein
VLAPPHLERLTQLLRRRLGVEVVRLLPGSSLAPETANTLSARLPDGPIVVVTFAERPANVEQTRDDLHALVQTFGATLQPVEGKRRAPVARSLYDELRALATRAMAHDAVILDAQSPVIWGSANTAPVRVRQRWDNHVRDLSGAVLTGVDDEDDDDDASNPNFATKMLRDSPLGSAFAADNSVADLAAVASGARATEPLDQPNLPRAATGDLDVLGVDQAAAVNLQLTATALEHLRAQPELELAAKGRPFTLRHRGESIAYFAQSFAGIYVLALVFDGVFDELRSERAAAEALPRIEALVLALPPQGPDGGPTADTQSLRKK